jgi:hypothetical protein
MPLSAQGFGNNPKIARILHYGIYIYFLSILGGLTLDIARVKRESILGELWLIPILIGCAAVIGHYQILCERCMANMPLDGPQRAERRKIFLRLSHSMKLLVAIAIIFLIVNVFDWAIRPLISDKPTRRLVEDLAVYLPTMLLMVSIQVHGRLQPWCPWCRGDGGDGEVERAPEPDPGRSNPSPIS